MCAYFRPDTQNTLIFMPPKELWEAYSNCTVRPSVSPSVRATDMDFWVFLVIWR